MTKEQVIQGYLMNSPKVVAEMLYDTIEKYENRSCNSCKYSYDIFESFKKEEDKNQDFICTLLKVDKVFKKDFYCNKWESK